MTQLFANQKWRWLGLVPILIWIYTLIIYLSIVKNLVGLEHASQAWQFVFWACPMACLMIGLGILLKNRFLTGTGALWGLSAVLLMSIASILLPQTPKGVNTAEDYSIPYLKLSPEYSSEITERIGSEGIIHYIFSDFAIHWIGCIVFGIIGLILVGLGRWSFVGTIFLLLFHTMHLEFICPFTPSETAGEPSMFMQLIPMTIIFVILNYSIYNLKYEKQKNNKILFGILTLYFATVIATFSYAETISEIGPMALLLGYFMILGLGKITINKEAFLDFLKRYNQRKNKIVVYISYGYAVLFLLFYIFMMLPELSKEGEGPVMPFILFGLIPFAVIFTIGFYLIPKLRKSERCNPKES